MYRAVGRLVAPACSLIFIAVNDVALSNSKGVPDEAQKKAEC